MYQLDLFLDTPIRKTKKEMIVLGFQSYLFWLGCLALMYGPLILIIVRDRTWQGPVCGILIGIQLPLMFRIPWQKFLIFTLLRYPRLKAGYRKKVRPFIQRLGEFRRST